jgi:putative endonuclease
MLNKEDHSSIRIGNDAEKAVEKMLQDAGLKILERNYRCKMGEIDIVAKESVAKEVSGKAETIVFVEVRQRSHRGFGSGFDSVDYRKQKKLVRTASLFLQERKFFDQYPCRFDIVSVRSLTDMQWIKDAFQST